MKIKKLAVVGPGLMGLQHIKRISKSQRCSLLAIVAPDHEQDRIIASEQKVPLLHTVEELLNKHSPDGVIVSSPNKFHVQQSICCIERNIPVLIEKPIAHDYKSSLKILEAVEKKKSKVLVGHHRSYSPIIAAAASIIRQNKLGKIVNIIGSAVFFKPEEYFLAGPWRKEKGGGPILINLIHEIGNYRALCGEIDAVSAISSNSVRRFKVEDSVAVNFKFKNGALGTFMLSDTTASSKSWEQTSGENPVFASYQDDDCYYIGGTMGTLSLPTMKLRSATPNLEPSWLDHLQTQIIKIEKQDPLENQLNHFLDYIEGTAEPIVSVYDGMNNLKVLEAIQQSAKRGKVVYL